MVHGPYPGGDRGGETCSCVDDSSAVISVACLPVTVESDTSIDESRIERDVPLGPMTTMGVGGPADLLYRAQSVDDLVAAVDWARGSGRDWFVLGSGANLVFGDGGFRGVVIRNESDRVTVSGDTITAESGAIVADLIEIAEECGLSGLEHFVGIPSTVGGALWQNLHFLAPDRASTVYIESVLESARVLTDTGTVTTVDRAWFEFGYDTSRLQGTGHILLDATFRLKPSPAEAIRQVMWANAAWRAEKHPPGATRCSAGSIFQKIEGHGAGRLIDHAGLKGHRVGGMQISPVHANFIVNTGSGTASDLLQLIDVAQSAVRAEFGLELTPEISLVGEF